MRLGLKIEITSQGAGTAARAYNSTPALEKYASASRSYIKDIFPAREDLRLQGIDPAKSLDESSRTVIFLRFLGPEGYLICIFQARPENSGRPYDGAAAWIHIPSEVMLTGAETESLISDVETALSQDKGIDYQKLDQLFNKEYGQKTTVSILSSIQSKGQLSGIRFFGSGADFVLPELLGADVAQMVYKDYKAVFLLRKNSDIAVNAREITEPLVKTVTVLAPSPVEGYTAYLTNGNPFNRDMEYPENSSIAIVWKKKGYQDISKTIQAKSDDAAKLCRIDKSEIKVVINKQIFKVTGDNGQTLANYDLYLDTLKLEDVRYIQEDILSKGLSVRVVAKGFDTYDEKHLIEANTQSIRIQLKKRHVSGQDYLYEGKGQRRQKPYLWGVGGFLLGGICVALVAFYTGFNRSATQTEPSVSSELPEMTDVNPSSDNRAPKAIADAHRNDESKKMAIAYLNSTDIWNRDSIDHYPDLQDLYEDLNYYEFDDIINKWGFQLKEVGIFEKVVKAAEKAKNRGLEPNRDPHTPSYNKENDHQIDLRKYIDWISKEQASSSSRTTLPESEPNHIKGKTSKDIKGGEKKTHPQKANAEKKQDKKSTSNEGSSPKARRGNI